MTLEEVANKINVSRQAVAKWENGDSVPNLMNCVALADLYDVVKSKYLLFIVTELAQLIISLPFAYLRVTKIAEANSVGMEPDFAYHIAKNRFEKVDL